MSNSAISVLKTRAWADLLHLSTGVASISGAEKLLFSECRFRKTRQGNFSRPGILRRWLNGTRPNEDSLLRMDRRVAGSLYFYNHPLWVIAACDGDPPVALLYPLAPVVGSVLFHLDIPGPMARPALVGMHASMFHRLQSMPSIDALAALLFCSKHCHAQGSFELAVDALQSFYRLALRLGVYRPLVDVVAPLVAIVLAGFSLQPWTQMRWLPSQQVEQFVSDVGLCLVAESIQQESKTGARALSWKPITDLLAEWFDPDSQRLWACATRLCPMLDSDEMDTKMKSLFGDRTGAWMAIEDLYAPCNWTLKTKFRRRRTVCITEGLLAGSSYEE